MNLSRRSFLKRAGLGAAALRLGPVSGASREDLGIEQQSSSQRRIGYCIVGLGRISMGQFMPGVRISQRSRLTALVSGHRDKAEKMADQYGIPRRNIYSYENYDEIAHNSEIDAVYIALPNSMHAEYTIRAAQAGKHVLCEKPMATSVADCERMIEACRQAKRKLMIAYRCQYEPTHLRAIHLLRQGYAGRLEMLDSSLGFNIAAGEWRLNKKMAGGGPLVDVGIYSLQACRYLTGEEPVEVSATWSVIDHDGRFNEVEENLAWTMRFPSGVLASCWTSYGSNGSGNFCRAMGSRGWLEINPAFSYEGLHLRADTQGGPPIDQPADDPAPCQFMREADHLAECILEDHEPKTPGEEGLRDQKLIEAIYRSCQEDRPVKV
jgi:predicted dehydrogenase